MAMKKLGVWVMAFPVVLFLIVAVTFFPGSALSVSCEDSCSDRSESERLSCLQEVRQACEAKLAETTSKKTTLQSAVNYLNSQIALTQSKINQTIYQIEQLEKEIELLTAKIAILDTSLEETTQVLLKRIAATYKQVKLQPLFLLVASDGFSDFINRYKYLRAAQTNDRKIMFELEQERATLDQQKILKEEKQEEVLGLKTDLIGQKGKLAEQQAGKKKVLEETKNDEKRYQDLLARARAEFEAIQNVLAGGGTETEVGNVSEGQTIARMISGASCNSNGPHLHFTAVKGNSVENPFNYLKSVDHENCSGSSCGSTDGDSFSPSGDWNWPVDTPVKFSQGYGETWAVRNTWVGSIYRFHNGLDIYNSSLTVKSTKAGKLFRGSYVGASGCTLRYVKVDHSDSDIDTYYLHVDYL